MSEPELTGTKADCSLSVSLNKREKNRSKYKLLPIVLFLACREGKKMKEKNVSLVKFHCKYKEKLLSRIVLKGHFDSFV